MSLNETIKRVYDHDCSDCRLAAFCNNICMEGSGLVTDSQSYDILIVNDSPSSQDDNSGSIKSSNNFDLLEGILKNSGIPLDKIYYTNLVKCASYDPLSGTPVPAPNDAIEACAKYLWEEIDLIKPKLIIALGKNPTGVLTDKWKVGQARGNVYLTTVETSEGSVNIPVIPTWNPNYILRGNEDARVELISDILYAKTYLYGEDENTQYKLINNPEMLVKFTDWLVNQYESGKLEHDWIAVDIETNHTMGSKKASSSPYDPDTTIVSIQITWKEGYGVLIPVIRPSSPYDSETFESCFNDPINIKILKNCLEKILSKIPVVGQNYTFDYKYIYTKLGIKTQNLVFDTMLAHHMMNGGSLPNSLDYMVVRYLNKSSHKKELKDWMDKLPKEDKNFGNVPLNILMRYGCGDTDSTYRLAAVFKKMLQEFTYDKYNQSVEYNNMYEAFMDLYMKPFEMIVSMEIEGSKLDMETWPKLEQDLLKEMEEQVAIVTNSKFFDKWQKLSKTENPKRLKKVRNTKYRWHVLCESCGSERVFEEGSSPNCLDCGEKGEEKKAPRNLKVKFRKRENPDYGSDLEPKFVVDENEPEFIIPEFNMNSNPHLMTLIYDCMGFNRQKHGDSTDKSSMASIMREATEKKSKADCVPILQAITKYKKSSKLHSAYFKSLPRFLYVDGTKESPFVTKPLEPDTGVNFIHTNYLQHGTTSGRLSTRDPSLHTMPFKSIVKKMFVSRHNENGLILQADYSQLEVRIFAVKTQDKGLIKVYQDNGDVHRYAASLAFLKKDMSEVTEKERKISKAVTFRIIYGGGPEGMGEQSPELNLTLEQARQIFKNFLGMMPTADKWISSQKKFVRDHGIALSRLGRIRPLHEEVKNKSEVGHAERVGVNFPIQSLGNDIGLQSLARVHEDLKSKKTVLFGSVHDSAIIDLYSPELFDTMNIVQNQMSTNAEKQFPWFNVPLRVDMEIGTSWGDLVSVKDWSKDGKLILDGPVDDIKSVMKVLNRSYDIKIINREMREKDCTVEMNLNGKQ